MPGLWISKKPKVNDVQHEKCCGELHQHVKHVNYKAFVWKSTLEANQEIPEADQHGWGVIDKTYKAYKVHWMENQTTLEKILELVVCGKCIEQCQCVLLQVPCTNICKCKGECMSK